VAAFALALMHRVAGRPLMADAGRGRPMIQVTGTLFAVVLGFVILSAFQTYNGARTGAQSEAQASTTATNRTLAASSRKRCAKR
jgi:hypothetical protein